MGKCWWLLCAIWIVLGALPALATLPVRIAAVDDSTRARLSGGVSPRVALATDLGAAAADKQLPSMALRFSMTSAQQAALTRLLGDLQDPASPQYHQWLTPEQFAAQFGMSSSDIAQVKSWLSAQGFTVTQVSRGGQFVRFSGTVAQAERAFQTQIERVSLHGEEHVANTTAPSLPASIAAVTTTVTGLNDFRMHAHHVRSTIAPQTSSDSLKPQFTLPHSGIHYLAPGDLYTMYDVQGLLSSNINGSGIKLAVVGQSDINLTDIAAFRSASGLSANVPTVTVYGTDPGVPTADDQEESELDVEWAGAMAPAASIVFATATDVIDGALTEAIDNNIAPVISMSYGDCEADLGVSQLAYYDPLLQQAAAQGITMVSSAGDSGASDCDYQVSEATNGFAVDFPASSPYMTAVGGTELNEGSGSYWSTTNNSNSGSATQYIPEVAWNDSSYGTLAAGGGGASAYFSKPSWQTGTGVPADASRDVPDVAMTASADHDPYLLCIPGYCASGYYSSSGYLAVVGGTSVSAPVVAGFLTLVVQQQGRIGVANNMLYALAGSTYAANVFHDVTSGNNDSPCVTGTTDCSSGAAFGFTAGVGYDQATGWGSLDAGNLVNDWPLVTAAATTPAGITPTIVDVAGSASSATAGTSITLTASVASAVSSVTATPTGTVQFTVDNVAVGSPVALSSGAATYTLDTTSLTTGAHTVRGAYSGDGTYLGTKGAFAITILSATVPDFSLSPSTASVTVASGSTSSGMVLTVTPVNGFTGSVSFAASSTASDLALTPAFSQNPVTISGTSPATTTLTFLAFRVQDRKGTLTTAGWMRAGAGMSLAALLLLLAPRRRRLGLMMMLVLAGGLLGASGCGGNSSSQTTQVNTTPGTYTITIFASGSYNGTNITRSSTITLTVQ